WWYNSHSIGVEHVGEAADSGSYKPAIYYASSQLVRYLTGKYDIPRDRAHIVGHDNMPAVRAADVSKMHVDPGPFWNWQQYMALVGAPVLPSGSLGSGLVTVAPVWPLHKEQVTGCFPETQSCVQDGLQSVNFVYLHTEARSNAPLITDPVLGQGTTNIGNDAARLFHGQTVAVSKTQLDSGGMWYQTWVNGVQGWFYSPWKAMTAFPAKGKIVTPKADKTTIPVYGQPVPEKEEFPANVITAPSPGSFWIKPATPLPYTVGAGQRYSLGDKNVPNEYFYAWSSTGDRAQFPGDHTVYKGEQKYLQIQFGSRVAFVKAADVNVTEAK
ncbi:MAG TPA: peptidoglycan recognition family protein, partial [Candidatus Saccharimonadales bacterium]|nr:peptidoglycan recognition family protein [Candidatus Saccharimonadales bacterium]